MGPALSISVGKEPIFLRTSWAKRNKFRELYTLPICPSEFLNPPTRFRKRVTLYTTCEWICSLGVKVDRDQRWDSLSPLILILVGKASQFPLLPGKGWPGYAVSWTLKWSAAIPTGLVRRRLHRPQFTKLASMKHVSNAHTHDIMKIIFLRLGASTCLNRVSTQLDWGSRRGDRTCPCWVLIYIYMRSSIGHLWFSVHSLRIPLPRHSDQVGQMLSSKMNPA